jgi:hypothetical protein
LYDSHAKRAPGLNATSKGEPTAILNT